MKRIGFLASKTGLLAIEIMAVVAVIAALLLGAAAWRLQSGPMDLAFAKDYIAEILQDEESGLHATIGDAAIYWPNLSGPVFVGIKNLQLLNKDGQKIVEIGETAIGLSRSRLLIGKIAPTELVIKKPGLRIVRRADNSLDFGFAARPGLDKDSIDPLEKLVQFVAHPGDETAENSKFYRLRALEIEDATIMVEDHVLGASWFAQGFDLSMKSGKNGLDANFGFNFPSLQEKVSDIRISVAYDWDTKSAEFSTRIQNFDPQFLTSRVPELGVLNKVNLSLDGTIAGKLSSDLSLQNLSAELKSQTGQVQIAEVRATPLSFQNFLLKATYSETEKTLTIDSLQLDLEGIPLSTSGSFIIKDAQIGGTMQAAIPELNHSQITALWPDILKDDKSREWIVEKIKTGHYTNLAAETEISAQKTEKGWGIQIPRLTSSFDFKGMDVDYHAPLAPVKSGEGSAVFDMIKDTLTIQIKKGSIGDINVSQGSLLFTDIIKPGQGNLLINAKTTGPLKGFLSYAEKEPISMTGSLGFDIQKTKGQAAVEVMLDFPTRADVKLVEFKIDIQGTLKDTLIPAAVGNLDLTGGPITIKADQEKAVIEGSALLGGRPITLKREGFLRSEGKPYKNKTTAKISADDALRAGLGMDLTNFLSGNVDINLTQTEYADGKTSADIAVDLTQGRFFIDALGFDKPPGVAGTAKMTALLENGSLSELKDLTVETENFKLDPAQLNFTTQNEETVLHSAKIPHIAAGDTNAAVDVERSKEGQLKIVIKGPFLDARPFLDKKPKEKKPYSEPPMLISIAVDQMRTADDQTVKNTKIYADIDSTGAFDQFEVDAIAGAGAVYLRFKPDENGKRVYHFEADDAGAALKAFGVYNNVIGGTITMYAEPMEGRADRNMAGSALLQNFKVVKAPALARLLGALSLPGLLQLLGNDGLVFSKLEANFQWLYDPDGSVLVVEDGRTSGNSVGLTFDGAFDQSDDTMDIEGTIIPLSTVNKIVGSIPLLGDIITGGTGSVFAATYTMKGETEDPDVMVNPLSVLTPGILRRILFE